MAVPAEKIFDVVLDVENYKNFLPFCKDSKVTKLHGPDGTFEADLVIGFNSFSASYTSLVTSIKR